MNSWVHLIALRLYSAACWSLSELLLNLVPTAFLGAALSISGFAWPTTWMRLGNALSPRSQPGMCDIVIEFDASNRRSPEYMHPSGPACFGSWSNSSLAGLPPRLHTRSRRSGADPFFRISCSLPLFKWGTRNGSVGAIDAIINPIT